MKGFVIFRHAVRQLVMGIGPALRISAVLWIATSAFGYILDVEGDLARWQVMTSTFGGGLFPWQSVLPYALLSFVSYAWIAVGWHRFVLLDETPGIILPAFKPGRMLAYIGRSLQTALAALLLISVFGLAVVGIGAIWGLVHERSAGVAMLLFVILVAPVALVGSARLVTATPAPAINATFSLTETWQATRDANWVVLLAYILLLLVGLVVSLPGSLLFQPLTMPSAIWQAFGMWVSMMLSLSVTTTLYGHYVEGRPLV